MILDQRMSQRAYGKKTGSLEPMAYLLGGISMGRDVLGRRNADKAGAGVQVAADAAAGVVREKSTTRKGSLRSACA